MTAGNGLPCAKCGTREWYAGGECKKCVKERRTSWQRNNREKTREYNTKHRRNNPEKTRERDAARRQNNRERLRDYRATYCRNNPDKVNAYTHYRRTKKAGNGGSYTAAEWQSLCNHYGNKCLRCGRDCVKLTFDHVIPVSKGGTSDISNGQPLCLSCNCAKHDRHIDYRPDAGPMRWMQPALLSTYP